MTNDTEAETEKEQQKENLDGKGRKFARASKKVAVSWTHETCILGNRKEGIRNDDLWTDISEASIYREVL